MTAVPSNPQLLRYACTNKHCPRLGVRVADESCRGCAHPTTHELLLASPQRQGAPAAAPQSGPSTGDVISRVVFGGFWTLVTIGCAFAGFALLSGGNASGLLALGIGALSGLYARYIFRGGRFRILFW